MDPLLLMGMPPSRRAARLTRRSFVDLWSPSNQFKNCYGLIEFDRATGDIRRKASADWFETLTRANTLEL